LLLFSYWYNIQRTIGKWASTVHADIIMASHLCVDPDIVVEEQHFRLAFGGTNSLDVSFQFLSSNHLVICVYQGLWRWKVHKNHTFFIPKIKALFFWGVVGSIIFHHCITEDKTVFCASLLRMRVRSVTLAKVQEAVSEMAWHKSSSDHKNKEVQEWIINKKNHDYSFLIWRRCDSCGFCL
jgi:hypothetical protein